MYSCKGKCHRDGNRSRYIWRLVETIVLLTKVFVYKIFTNIKFLYARTTSRQKHDLISNSNVACVSAIYFSLYNFFIHYSSFLRRILSPPRFSSFKVWTLPPSNPIIGSIIIRLSMNIWNISIALLILLPNDIILVL